MDYKHPVKYPDAVKIQTYTTHIGTSSLGIGHELFSIKENKLVGKANSVVVMISYVSGEKVEISNKDRELLTQYLER